MPRGGARVGAGRRKKPTQTLVPSTIDAPVTGSDTVTAPAGNETPLEYMVRVMNDPGAEEARRDRLAVAAAPYMHPKQGEGGKKDEAKERAAAAVKKFAPTAAPRLVHSRG